MGCVVVRFPACECSERLHMMANYCARVSEHAYIRITRPENIEGNLSRVCRSVLWQSPPGDKYVTKI